MLYETYLNRSALAGLEISQTGSATDHTVTIWRDHCQLTNVCH